MNFFVRSAWLIMACALLSLPASAQLNQETHNPNSPIMGGAEHHAPKYPKAPGPGLTPAEMQFLKNAAQGGKAEVELGKLATEKAANPEVKEFGRRMVGDHSKVNADLKALAEKLGVPLPSDLTSSARAARQRLSQLSGQQFDAQYIQTMLKDHNHAVAAFKKEAYDAKNQEVKTFAGEYLPILLDHLHQAQNIAGKLGIKASQGSE